jgi:hypothetical protein
MKPLNLFKNVLHVIIAIYVAYKISFLTDVPEFTGVFAMICAVLGIGLCFIGVPAFFLETFQGVVADDKNPKWYIDFILSIVAGFVGVILSFYFTLPKQYDTSLLVFTIVAMTLEIGNLIRLYKLKKRK